MIGHTPTHEAAAYPIAMEYDRLKAENAKLRNSHDDLVAALELLLPMAAAFEKQASKGSGGRRGGVAFAKARAALAKVKAGAEIMAAINGKTRE